MNFIYKMKIWKETEGQTVWLGGGVPAGGFKHQGHGYWLTSMNPSSNFPDQIGITPPNPNFMPKINSPPPAIAPPPKKKQPLTQNPVVTNNNYFHTNNFNSVHNYSSNIVDHPENPIQGPPNPQPKSPSLTSPTTATSSSSSGSSSSPSLGNHRPQKEVTEEELNARLKAFEDSINEEAASELDEHEFKRNLARVGEKDTEMERVTETRDQETATSPIVPEVEMKGETHEKGTQAGKDKRIIAFPKRHNPPMDMDFDVEKNRTRKGEPLESDKRREFMPDFTPRIIGQERIAPGVRPSFNSMGLPPIQDEHISEHLRPKLILPASLEENVDENDRLPQSSRPVYLLPGPAPVLRPTRKILEEIISDDPYEILGVTDTASPETIKKAYSKLFRINHPDRHPLQVQLATRNSQKIAQAFDILEKRHGKYRKQN